MNANATTRTLALVEVIGHGGAGDFYDGNSPDSIRHATELGVDRIEVDILHTADGELVLLHDEHVASGDHAKVAVRSLTIVELRSLLPELLTLNDLAEMIGPGIPLYLDLKSPGCELLAVSAIRRLGPGWDVGVCTTYATSIRIFRRELPSLRLGLSLGHGASRLTTNRIGAAAISGLRRITPIPFVAAAKSCGATDLNVQHNLCTRRMVDRAHRAGLRVVVWTVNQPYAIDRVLRAGVDGITSNRPDRVRVLAGRD